jgi:choice-of-anchor A domain-containing protein
LVYGNGSVPHGAVAYGGTLTRGSSAYSYGGWYNATPVDFTQLTTDMLTWSDALAAQPVNGSYTNYYGGIVLTGTDPRLNVFSVPASDLASCTGLTINVPAGATALVNITGTTVRMANFGFQLLGGVDKEHIIYNMPQATTLTMGGIGIWGSILAPRANLDFSGANIDGQLIVRNYMVQGRVSGEAHPYYFVGCPWICQ